MRTADGTADRTADFTADRTADAVQIARRNARRNVHTRENCSRNLNSGKRNGVSQRCLTKKNNFSAVHKTSGEAKLFDGMFVLVSVCRTLPSAGAGGRTKIGEVRSTHILLDHLVLLDIWSTAKKIFFLVRRICATPFRCGRRTFGRQVSAPLPSAGAGVVQEPYG